MQIESAAQRTLVEKRWGHEEWIVNNDLYCGKRLYFKVERGHTSLHLHRNKHETMYVESGRFSISITDPATAQESHHHLIAGDSIVIPPMTPHRIVALTAPSVLVEFSTHHEDSDSYRIVP